MAGAGPDYVDNLNASLIATQLGQNMAQVGVAQSFAMDQARLAHLRADREIGMREAAASQELRTNGLASSILQQRSASDQPQLKTS